MPLPSTSFNIHRHLLHHHHSLPSQHHLQPLSTPTNLYYTIVIQHHSIPLPSTPFYPSHFITHQPSPRQQYLPSTTSTSSHPVYLLPSTPHLQLHSTFPASNLPSSFTPSLAKATSFPPFCPCRHGWVTWKHPSDWSKGVRQRGMPACDWWLEISGFEGPMVLARQRMKCGMA